MPHSEHIYRLTLDIGRWIGGLSASGVIAQPPAGMKPRPGAWESAPPVENPVSR
jgi:hypothetical protein